MTALAKRQHSRFEFAPPEGPQLQTSGRTYEIVDLSEGGLRFLAPRRGRPMTVGDVLRGIVQFRPGRSVEVRGRICRVSRGEVAAQLDAGIPLQTILEERHYPPRGRTGMAW